MTYALLGVDVVKPLRQPIKDTAVSDMFKPAAEIVDKTQNQRHLSAVPVFAKSY